MVCLMLSASICFVLWTIRKVKSLYVSFIELVNTIISTYILTIYVSIIKLWEGYWHLFTIKWWQTDLAYTQMFHNYLIRVTFCQNKIAWFFFVFFPKNTYIFHDWILWKVLDDIACNEKETICGKGKEQWNFVSCTCTRNKQYVKLVLNQFICHFEILFSLNKTSTFGCYLKTPLISVI